MPLAALVDGVYTCAPLLDDAQWSALRRAEIRFHPCGEPGFARVSALGTRHFVHKQLCSAHGSESPEHLRMKALVATHVAAAGWEARTEVPGSGYVADVLAQVRGVRVAFEIQRSRQDLQTYHRRQRRYQDDGVRAVWLAAAVPAGIIPLVLQAPIAPGTPLPAGGSIQV